MRRFIAVFLFSGAAAIVEPCIAADPATGPSESILGPAAREEPAAHPASALIIQGGIEETLYRGWPICIQFHGDTENTKVPAALTIKGPSPIKPQPAPNSSGVWLISQNESKALAPGSYTFSAGEVQQTVQIADEPKELTPVQKLARQTSLIAYAAASGDLPAAEKLARDWVKAEPQSSDAQAALGDILVQSGNLPDALAAYQEAISHLAPGSKPPRELYRRAAAIRFKLASDAAMPANDSVSTEEAAYYKIISEGDAARKAKNDSAALKAYERAKKYHADHKLTLKLRELEEKIAFVRQHQSTPAK